ncbi:hypothetical protein Tco_1317468 [Tanacetum coccineum]
MSGSSKGTKSQLKSSRKSVQSEEPVFEVADSDLPQDQEGNLGDNEDEPRKETASRRGVSTMTYTTSTTKSKAAKYDLPGIEDIVPNIWSLVKVAYDRYAYGYSCQGNNGNHGFEYWKECMRTKADNILYRFKEGDFPRLRINNIEDMLILVVQNRLTNLSGDDVADFAITLRMFTKSLVIQKQVEDLNLELERYQKKINIPR